MSLEQLSKTVDFVQDATPSASDANDGETYLDTSQSPPQLKVFDAGVSAFVRPRSIQNLDAPVSGAGAAQTDIKSGAEGALEQDIANLSPSSNSVAANLDGGVAAVDWSSKTPKYSISETEVANGNTETAISVTGSGYITSIFIRTERVGAGEITFTVDGSTYANRGFSNTVGSFGFQNIGYYSAADESFPMLSFDGIIRFDSSFEITTTEDLSTSVKIQTGVNHVLD